MTPSSFARLGLLESLPLRLGVGRPVSPLAPVLSLLEELSRISQVPRVPFRAFALLLDPGRISTPSLLRRFDSAPAVRTTKAPTFNIISRLNHTAFAPLHTLRAAIADDYAMFASGRWLAFAGWGCFPHWVPVLCFRVLFSFRLHALPHILGFLDATCPPVLLPRRLLPACRNDHSDDDQAGDHETNSGAHAKGVEHGEQEYEEERTTP